MGLTDLQDTINASFHSYCECQFKQPESKVLLVYLQT